MGILSFLLFILLAIAVMGLAVVAWIVNSVHKATGKLKGKFGSGASPRKQSNVSDLRDPSVAKRKIIPQDEGEYVDFEEVK